MLYDGYAGNCQFAGPLKCENRHSRRSCRYKLQKLKSKAKCLKKQRMLPITCTCVPNPCGQPLLWGEQRTAAAAEPSGQCVAHPNSESPPDPPSWRHRKHRRGHPTSPNAAASSLQSEAFQTLCPPHLLGQRPLRSHWEASARLSEWHQRGPTRARRCAT